MKKNAAYIVLSLIIILFSLSACERSQSTPFPVAEVPSPTAGVLTQLPDALASQTAAPTAQPTPEPATPTNTPEEPVSEPPAPTEELPEPTIAPSLEPLKKGDPTATLIATPSGLAFDPLELYGEPERVDPMDGSSIGNWKDGNALPNTAYLQIFLEDDQVQVRGKQLGFSTWFFSWPAIKDFYLEMSANSGDCTDKDEYGLIVRGPTYGAGVSYGYIIAFSCDGGYRVARLDSADPFSTTELLSPRQSEHIQAGANQHNVMGIKASGETFTIFANGHQIAEVSDSAFRRGRFGIFVQGVDTINYTYQPTQLAYWILAE